MADVESPKKPSKKDLRHAAKQNEIGLRHYGEWEMDKAVDAFQEATAADPENPEYHLNLARAYARSNDFHKAIRSLGDYLRTETDENVASRYERLFSSALDDVETLLIETMEAMDLPVPLTGKAIQMWLEYRITVGRRPLPIPKPQLWAAALTYAVCKINLQDVSRSEVAEAYDVSERSLKEKSDELINTLDLMPADFRYFIGDDNPLDKLVEAAQMLEEMYARFFDE
ncbi:MAG: tetratricopeptide repeat protein [Candidatus Promineifilaceae bacterium]|nr:tetratricopeptide repeat protein [Candidatus Promineifilaceae bacterium]